MWGLGFTTVFVILSNLLKLPIPRFPFSMKEGTLSELASSLSISPTPAGAGGTWESDWPWWGWGGGGSWRWGRDTAQKTVKEIGAWGSALPLASPGLG